MAVGQNATYGTIGFGETSLALAFGSIPSNDDIILLLYVQTVSGPASRIWPSGFTEAFHTDAGDGSVWIALAWKRAASEGSATYTLNLGDSGDSNQQMIGTTLTGRKTTGDPIEVIGAAAVGFGTPQTAAGITTLTNGSDHVIFVGANDAMSAPAATGYSSYSDPTFKRSARLHKEIATAGSTGSVSLTGIAGSGVNIWVAISVAPAGAGGPEERTLAGSLPSATGTTARTLQAIRATAGAQPSGTGALARSAGAFSRGVTGAQPAPTGAASRLLAALRTAAGAMGAPSGALETLASALRALAGSMGAPTGTVSRSAGAFARAAEGSQPAPTGAVSRVLAAVRALAGAQGEPAGTLEAALGLILRSLSGAMGAPSATLGRTLSALRSADGLLPAPEGVLARTGGAFARALAGAQDAAEGALSRALSALRSLAGLAGAPTGTLAGDVTIERSLAGLMGEPSGTLAYVATLAPEVVPAWGVASEAGDAPTWGRAAVAVGTAPSWDGEAAAAAAAPEWRRG